MPKAPNKSCYKFYTVKGGKFFDFVRNESVAERPIL
jgi:hypothetical protein